MEALLINLVSGAIGGNVAGGLLKNLNQGTLINSIAGIAGGGLGGSILSMLGAGGIADTAGAGGLDIASILGQVATGGVGGGVLLAVVGVVRNMLAK
ncbi:hypothetical protein [Aliiroseovarius sp. S1123]|uniref:hypothetical protein n=1 Tax=unclassified Aliiroseovarius TaxID=2623558 RepID=UPI001FF61186|nr:hypothetical protein [uncultured Aliiroseovarius sp.]MCK0171293.1 hypothetical protein [Aliiroseovarius sp. S1123]